jgi:SM-20-related protein
MRAMQIPSDHPLLLRIVDDLAANGWSQQNIFLPLDLTRALAAECRKRAAEGELAPAAVGRGPTSEIREGIRGDHIQWIEPGQAEACDSYLGLMDSLREAMNRDLFLGLEDFESHFAMYPPGAFYLKHLDRFRDDDRRMVSAVVYLNDAWPSSTSPPCPPGISAAARGVGNPPATSGHNGTTRPSSSHA